MRSQIRLSEMFYGRKAADNPFLTLNVMPVERSAGIILFRDIPGGREYLLLRSSRDRSQIDSKKSLQDFWDFPKGILNQGESGIDAAKREAREETGIDELSLIGGFKETVSYFTRRGGKTIPKFVAMFLAKTNINKIKLSWEHDDYRWLLYDEAINLVSLPQMKKVLDAAAKFLPKI